MHILIVRNNSNAQAMDASLLLATYAATQGIGYALVDSSDLIGADDFQPMAQALSEGVDLAVVLGGDGTILRTARAIGIAGIPILGINFGRLGFLANSSKDGVVAIVSAALAGDVVVEKRTNLRIDVVCEGEADPWGDDAEGEAAADESVACGISGFPPTKGARSFFALNEAAITRGANGRIIDFALDISGAHIAHMRGDGLVVSTATGSTAYALSAGGPLVSPGFQGLVAVPLAPHTLHSRAIVTDASDVVEMNLAGNIAGREATLFVDGELIDLGAPMRKVYVRRGDEPSVLLRYQREGFYEHAANVFFWNNAAAE